MKFFRTLLYLFLFLAVSAGIFLVPNLLKLTKVDCSSQFGPCSNYILEYLEKYQESSLRVGKREISNFLSTQSPIEDFSLRFRLPSTLVVSILEKKARFAIFDKGKNVYATVDENGGVLAIFKETNLPYLETVSNSLNVGEKISGEELSALNLQEKVYSKYQVKNGELVGSTLIVALPEGYTVLFPLDRDPNELVGALSLILSALKGEAGISKIEVETNIKTIDLRFKNPVLK